MCTDPKLLREAITPKPEEFIYEMSINTFLGERITFCGAWDWETYCTDSVKSLWKSIDFVYDPVSFTQYNPNVPFDFNQYDPIVSVCYELNVPISQQTQGIQNIIIEINHDIRPNIKISPPGYLHQNIDVRTRHLEWEFDTTWIELEYQIDHILTDENCHPDPSFNRDECVTKQLLDVKSILKDFMRIETLILQSSIKLFGCIPPALGNYGLPTCKNGSEYPMREVNKLINCPEACTKYTMRLQSESFWGGQFDFPKLTIKFKKQIIVTYDQYSYIWLNLVAEVGGYVGLFLGFSVFQLTDLMDVLLQRNWIESFKSLLNRFKRSKD